MEIEKQVQFFLLPAYVVKPSDSDQFKEQMINKIADSEIIQHHWTSISQNIDSEEDAIELLKVTVRGWINQNHNACT